MPPEAQAKGNLSQRLTLLQQKLNPLREKLEQLPEVKHATYMVEGLVEGLFMPDRGFSGLPMYLTADAGRHLRSTYHEPELGQGRTVLDPDPPSR